MLRRKEHKKTVKNQVKIFLERNDSYKDNSKVKKDIKDTKPLISIIHFNDAYEIRENKNEDLVGGVPRFLGQINQLKKSQDALVFFSGDLYSPNKCKHIF